MTARRLWLTLAAILSFLPPVRAAIVVTSAPKDEPLSTAYEVQILGGPVPVYAQRVLDPPFDHGYDHGGNYSFATFDADEPYTVRIRAKDRSLAHAVIRPEIPELKRSMDGDWLVLQLDHPRKIIIEPDGKKSPLFLFVNYPELRPPGPDTPGVVYFGPGIHTPGIIKLGSDQILYLAPGSIVKGVVQAEGSNIKIKGRGILDGNDWAWQKAPGSGHMIDVRAQGVSIEDIIIRGAPGWTIVPTSTEGMTIRNVKICNSRVQNDDGIDICNSRQILIADCFIRTDDDCIALKGLELNYAVRDVEEITIKDCLLWCDRARIFLLGHESRAENMRNISVWSSEILHFALTPFLLQPGEDMRLSNVRFEDILVHGEGQESLIDLSPIVNQYMYKKVPGFISDITFRNLRLTGDGQGKYAVTLQGADATHTVERITFDNDRLFDQPLRATSPQVKIGPFVDGVQFIP